MRNRLILLCSNTLVAPHVAKPARTLCLCGEGPGCPHHHDVGDHPICYKVDEENQRLEDGCEFYGVEELGDHYGKDYYCSHCARLWHRRHDPLKEGEIIEIGYYETGSNYGGPEEGGWWYETGERVEFLRIPYSEAALEAAKAHLIATFGPERSRTSRMHGIQYKYGRDIPVSWPARQPHYE